MERVVRDAEDELLAGLEKYDSIDEIEAVIKAGDPPPEIVVTFKLRRVLVLHDGTNRSIQDVAVARVNSIDETRRDRHPKWYRRLEDGVHPMQYLIGGDERHGTNGVEAYVDATSVASIRKATILRRAGQLNEDEMRAISGRVITALEIDVSEYVDQLGSVRENME
jgi:hypothetical protein